MSQHLVDLHTALHIRCHRNSPGWKTLVGKRIPKNNYINNRKSYLKAIIQLLLDEWLIYIHWKVRWLGLQFMMEYAWSGSSVCTQEVKKHILLCTVLHKLHSVKGNTSSWLRGKKSCYQGKFVEWHSSPATQSAGLEMRMMSNLQREKTWSKQKSSMYSLISL